MCPQVRSESEALYRPEPGKSCPTEILEALAAFNAEGRPGMYVFETCKNFRRTIPLLQYSEREDMAGAKTKVVLGASNTSYVIGGLKKGRTYYIRLRSYHVFNGMTYFGEWSNVMNCKVK